MTLRDGWVELLNRQPWHHFAHVTWARTEPTREALEAEVGRWRERLCMLAGNAIWTAAVFEANARLHAHVLTGGTDRLPTSVVEGAWRRGIAEVSKYDPHLDGVAYMTKHVDAGLAELDVSGTQFVRRWRRLRAGQERGDVAIRDTTFAAHRTASKGRARRRRLFSRTEGR